MERTDIENKLKYIIKNNGLAKEYKNFVIFGSEEDNRYVFGEYIE